LLIIEAESLTDIIVEPLLLELQLQIVGITMIILILNVLLLLIIEAESLIDIIVELLEQVLLQVDIVIMVVMVVIVLVVEGVGNSYILIIQL
jgi:hypothetical protein